jgi:hypothetical protein
MNSNLRKTLRQQHCGSSPSPAAVALTAEQIAFAQVVGELLAKRWASERVAPIGNQPTNQPKEASSLSRAAPSASKQSELTNDQ